MRLKIGVRTKKIYKMGLSSKIGTFGRFERGPFVKDQQCQAISWQMELFGFKLQTHYY
jgi:hypothetical protein